MHSGAAPCASTACRAVGVGATRFSFHARCRTDKREAEPEKHARALQVHTREAGRHGGDREKERVRQRDSEAARQTESTRDSETGKRRDSEGATMVDEDKDEDNEDVNGENNAVGGEGMRRE